MTRLILALCFVSMATVTAAANAPTPLSAADSPTFEESPPVHVAPRCGVAGPNGATARCASIVRPQTVSTVPPAPTTPPPLPTAVDPSVEPAPPRPHCPAASISDGRRRCGTVHPQHVVRPEPPAPVNITPLDPQVQAEVLMIVDLTSALVDGFSQFDANTPLERFETTINVILAQRQLTPQLLMARVIGLTAQVKANPEGAMAFMNTQQQRIESILARASELPSAANTAMRNIFG